MRDYFGTEIPVIVGVRTLSPEYIWPRQLVNFPAKTCGGARSAATTRAASRRSRLLNEYGKFSRHVAANLALLGSTVTGDNVAGPTGSVAAAIGVYMLRWPPIACPSNAPASRRPQISSASLLDMRSIHLAGGSLSALSCSSCPTHSKRS
jgi:hypothetical protein